MRVDHWVYLEFPQLRFVLRVFKRCRRVQRHFGLRSQRHHLCARYHYFDGNDADDHNHYSAADYATFSSSNDCGAHGRPVPNL